MSHTTGEIVRVRTRGGRARSAPGRHAVLLFVRRGWRYLRVVSWLLLAFAKGFPLAAAAMVVLPVVSVALKVLALAIPIAYIHAQVDQHPVDAKLMQIPYDPTGDQLLGFASLALLLGVASAGGHYLFAVLSFRHSRLFVEHVARQAGEILCRSTGFDYPARAAAGSGRFVSGLFGKDGLYLIRAIRVGSMQFIPGLLLAAAVAIMLTVSVSMTALIALFTGVFGIPMYLVNLRIVRASQSREALEPVGGASRAFVRELGESHDPIRSITDYTSGEAYQNAIAGLRGILITKDQARLVSELLIFSAVTGVLFMFGNGGAGVNWSLLLAFFLAMHHGVTAGGQLAMGVTAFNRFYPQISRVADFFAVNRDPQTQGPYRLDDLADDWRGRDIDDDEDDDG